MCDIYTIELIQAVSDWQRFGWGEQKQQRASDLKRVCTNISPKFRQAPEVCYRRLNLTGDKLLILGDTGFLPEETSSWTTDLDVAKNFTAIPKFGHKLANVFTIIPTPESVVVSITALFNDSDFQKSIDVHKSSIIGFDEGIGAYADSEKEVVITNSAIPIEDIITWGGHSSFTQEELDGLLYYIFKFINEVEPTPEQFKSMRDQMVKDGDVAGANWLKNKAAVNRLRDKTISHAKRLLSKKP